MYAYPVFMDRPSWQHLIWTETSGPSLQWLQMSHLYLHSTSGWTSALNWKLQRALTCSLHSTKTMHAYSIRMMQNLLMHINRSNIYRHWYLVELYNWIANCMDNGSLLPHMDNICLGHYGGTDILQWTQHGVCMDPHLENIEIGANLSDSCMMWWSLWDGVLMVFRDRALSSHTWVWHYRQGDTSHSHYVIWRMHHCLHHCLWYLIQLWWRVESTPETNWEKIAQNMYLLLSQASCSTSCLTLML